MSVRREDREESDTKPARAKVLILDMSPPEE